jgi:hypothetical protein
MFRTRSRMFILAGTFKHENAGGGEHLGKAAKAPGARILRSGIENVVRASGRVKIG